MQMVKLKLFFVDLWDEPNPKTVELVHGIQSYCDIVKDVITEEQIIRMVSAKLDTEAAIPDSDEKSEEAPPPSVSITEALNALHSRKMIKVLNLMSWKFYERECMILRN